MDALSSRWQPLLATQFRLLRLHRHNDDTTDYELEVQNMDKPPPFAALSYVCGTEQALQPFRLIHTGHAITGSVSANSKYEEGKAAVADHTWTISIMANLEIALKLLSTSHRDGKSFLGYDYLWIDAICINQVDLKEKAAQVSSMYRIYTIATEVIVCLGEEEDLSSGVITVLNEVAVFMANPHANSGAAGSTAAQIVSTENVRALARALTDRAEIYQSEPNFAAIGLPPPQHALWPALARLYSREWFHRLWTFQEAMLAQKCYVICGGEGIEWRYMLKIAESLTTTQLMYVSQSHFRMPRRITDPRVQALISHFDFPYDGELGKGGWFPLHLNLTRSREVTESRDRVYAILSLAPPDVTRSVKVDYNIPLPQLYMKFTKALLSYFPLGGILAMVETAERAPELPTWCPDYSQPPTISTYPRGVSLGRKWKKFYKEDPKFEQLIQLGGAKVDTVHAVVDNFTWQWRGGTPDVFGPNGDAASILRWLEACWSLVQEQTSRSTPEAENVFTSAILAEVASNPNQDPPYPDHAVEGLRAVKLRMKQLQDASSQNDVAPLQEHLGMLMQPVFTQLGNIWRSHIFFATEGGRFGIASRHTKVGDTICVLFGETQMFILRQVKQVHHFVSSAHVTDFSDGRGFPDLMAIQEVFKIV